MLAHLFQLKISSIKIIKEKNQQIKYSPVVGRLMVAGGIICYFK